MFFSGLIACGRKTDLDLTPGRFDNLSEIGKIIRLEGELNETL